MSTSGGATTGGSGVSPATPAPVSVGGVVSAQNSSQATAGTSRVPFYLACAATNLRLLYPGWYINTQADTDLPSSVSINASIEVAGVIYRVTFAGQTTGAMQGGPLLSDPLALSLPAGTLIYVRTFNVTQPWYPNRYANPQAGGQGGWTVTTDLTAPGSGVIADAATFTPMLAPAAVLGTPQGTAYPKTVALYGDSIAYGQGDGIGNGMGVNTVTPNLGGGGYIARGLRTLGVGLINAGVQGDTVGNFVTPASVRRLSLLPDAKTFICEYGRNDVSNLVALATIQANLITAWNLASKIYYAVLQACITPRPNSTDGYQTLGNQTLIVAAEAIRVPLNTWLRAGAPMVAGVAVAVGTAGAIIAGNAAHPLSAVFDPCQFVESAPNSGLWLPGTNSRTVNDGTTAGSIVTSATIAFVAGDLGRTIIIPGAGAAAGLYVGTIARVNTASNVNVLQNTATAIGANAAVTIVDTFTQDGTHPTPPAAALAAASVQAISAYLR